MPVYGSQVLGIIGTETTLSEVGGPLRLRLQADTISPPTSNLQQYKIAQVATIRFSPEGNGAKRGEKS
jgi:hypothetical protein